mmetsp:Transcript_116880/g.294031  ORF Transcript_116880/g.294031 Transcript_116880/m.294031 type:complete len:101 (+) Transcript_116880:20-322(+)
MEAPCPRSTRRRGTAGSSLPSTLTTRSSLPQSVITSGTRRELYAEHWGITTGEIRKLIEECQQQDPTWTRRTTIRTLVNEHVKPRTAGGDHGFALVERTC